MKTLLSCLMLGLLLAKGANAEATKIELIDKLMKLPIADTSTDSSTTQIAQFVPMCFHPAFGYIPCAYLTPPPPPPPMYYPPPNYPGNVPQPMPPVSGYPGPIGTPPPLAPRAGMPQVPTPNPCPAGVPFKPGVGCGSPTAGPDFKPGPKK